MKKDVDKIKKTLTNALELPLDIALDIPKVIITGNIRVDIINHKGIVEYSDDLIRINTNIGMIKISGNSMEIKNVLMEEISIVGHFIKVEILE